ncbi:MAG: VTT domain-containing protein [Rhodocyclales bacterium]|nr:VTT domain-containing protein [Rhodocyclales bacterium]
MSLLLKYQRLIAALAFLAILFAVFRLSGLKDQFTIEFLQQQILSNRLQGLLVFVLLFVLGNLIQIPGWLFLAAAVLTLGRGLGGIATYVAASISCVASFFIIRFLGGDVLRKLDNRVAIDLLRRLDRRPVTSIVLLRTLFQTVPALNYALAMSGVKFRAYLAGTLLGLPLPIMLYCLFFDYLAKMLTLN